MKILQEIGHPIPQLGVCYVNNHQKGQVYNTRACLIFATMVTLVWGKGRGLACRLGFVVLVCSLRHHSLPFPSLSLNKSTKSLFWSTGSVSPWLQAALAKTLKIHTALPFTFHEDAKMLMAECFHCKCG